MVDIRQYRTKTALDLSSLSHVVPYAQSVGAMAALHVAGNSLLRPFLKGKLGGTKVQTYLAQKGFEHGAKGKVLHPIVSDLAKQVASPELMNSYELANKAGKTYQQNPALASAAINSPNAKGTHHALDMVVDGARQALSNQGMGIPDGSRLAKAKGWLSNKLQVSHDRMNELDKSKGFSRLRAGINMGTGAAALATLPGVGDHIAVNTVRTMISRTPKGISSVTNRLKDGYKGLPESSLKRKLIDYVVSPGYGEVHDIGKSLHDKGSISGLNIGL